MTNDARPALTTTTPAIDLMRSHRSVREFADRPVGDDAIEAMVEAALGASSHQGLFAWTVVAVRDAERKAALQQVTGASAFIADAPVLLVWVADMSRIAQAGVDAGSGAPTGLDYIEPYTIAVTDTTMAAENATVAAESLGLGICYIGGLRRNIGAVAELLGLPEHSFALFGMTVGYPADEAPAPADLKPRPPLAGVLFAEQYDNAAAAAGVAEIEQTIPAYYARAGRPGFSWRANAVRAMDAQNLMNGTGNRADLEQRGFAAR